MLNHLLCELVFLIRNNNEFGFVYSTAKWLASELEWARPGTIGFPTHITPINAFQLSVPCRKLPNSASFHTLVQGGEIFVGKENKTVCNCRHIITNHLGSKTDQLKQSNFTVLVSSDLVKAPQHKFFSV